MSTTKVTLVALAAIAAGTLAADQPEILAGDQFDVSDSVAATLVAEGKAQAVAPATPARSGKPVRVRLLADSEHGRANDVAELLPEVARALVKAGLADDDKAAVSYAATLPQNQPKAKSART
ncbi:MAG: hypothetical protein ACK40S_01610 [Burkholderiaceae bacterium]